MTRTTSGIGDTDSWLLPMPRAPRFTIARFEELFHALRYAPPETLRRQMEAAEATIDDVNPSRAYPWDFVVYRVTGYRPDGESGDDVQVVGNALVADLVSLIQRISDAIQLEPQRGEHASLSMDDVQTHLGVSAKTVQRYRRLGLVCHYVRDNGRTRLVCYRDALERFQAAHAGRLRKAKQFSRVSEDVQQQIVREARKLRIESASISLNEVALRVAPRVGRSHEAVRSILRRHDRLNLSPIFDEAGPLDERARLIIYRAWRFGVAPSILVKRFKKPLPTILRAVNMERRRQLVALDLQAIDLPTFSLPDADAIILQAPAVTRDLHDTLGDDLLLLLDSVHEAEPLAESLEDALVAAYNLLKRRARQAIDGLQSYPSETELDAIEVDLRWAAVLKRRLVALAFPSAVRSIEQYLGRRMRSDPGERVLRLSHTVLRVVSGTIDQLDPARDMRLERVTAFAVDRALATMRDLGPSGRAAARHQPGSLRLHRSERRFCEWQEWLEPRGDLAACLDQLDDDAAALVRQRHGWDGGRPHTIAELAAELQSTPAAVSRRLRNAHVALRRSS